MISVKLDQMSTQTQQDDFWSCVKNVTNECVDVDAFSSSERPTETDLNRNKRCLDTEFHEEDDKPQPLYKRSMFFLHTNINKYVS